MRNALVGRQYVELYAGGASVALSLLFDEFVSDIHINDVNKSVFAFWNAVLNHTDALARRITDTHVSMTEWRKQHNVQKAKEADLLDLAFSTFFLNRTNRSGVVWGGAIGGRHQDGEWRLDARYNKKELVRRIEKIARYRTRINLTNYDAAYFIEQRLARLGSRTFVYLDPPYYVKGEGLYEHFYRHDDHLKVAQLVHNLSVPWIVSYDACPEVLRIYAQYSRLSYRLSYSACVRRRGDEVMFLSRDLIAPDVTSPANIPLALVCKMRLGRAKGL